MQQCCICKELLLDDSAMGHQMYFYYFLVGLTLLLKPNISYSSADWVINAKGEPISFEHFNSKFQTIAVISEKCQICKKQIRDLRSECFDTFKTIAWLALGDIKKNKAHLERYHLDQDLLIFYSDSKNLIQQFSQTPSFIFKKNRIKKRGYQTCQQLISLK